MSMTYPDDILLRYIVKQNLHPQWPTAQNFIFTLPKIPFAQVSYFESRSSPMEDGMHFQRRQLLRILSFAFGSSFILGRNQLGIAAQTATPPKVSPPAAGAVATGAEMEKVTGIGGLFFRAHDPKALGSWYQQHLGVSLNGESV